MCAHIAKWLMLRPLSIASALGWNVALRLIAFESGHAVTSASIFGDTYMLQFFILSSTCIAICATRVHIQTRYRGVPAVCGKQFNRLTSLYLWHWLTSQQYKIRYIFLFGLFNLIFSIWGFDCFAGGFRIACKAPGLGHHVRFVHFTTLFTRVTVDFVKLETVWR